MRNPYIPILNWFLSSNRLKAFTLLIISLFFASIGNTQTSSILDGNWGTGGNWTAGVPTKDESVTITNNMNLNRDIEIDNGGSYFVNGGTINDGGATNKIVHQGTGYFEIAGNVTIKGTYELKNNADLIIRGCDTLRVGGSAIFENNSDLKIEPCGVLIVSGDLTLKNNFDGQIDGQISVGGDLLGENSSSLSGGGNIEIDGSVELKNSSNLFGNTSDCGGGCEYGSGQGLPIELISFEAEPLTMNNLKVNWSTASEVNNEYFRIEISADGFEYKILSEISGVGNSTVKTDYSIVRLNPFSNVDKVYLRMTQFDYDGKSEEFNSIVVYLNENTQRVIFNSTELVLYPNPNNGEEFNIQLKDLNSGNIQIEIIDISGRLLHQENKMITDLGSEQKFIITPITPLNKGIYLLRIRSEQYEISERFSVSK